MIARVAFVRTRVRVLGRLVYWPVLGSLDPGGVGFDRLLLHNVVGSVGQVKGRIMSRLIDHLQPSLIPTLSAPISSL